MASMVEDTQVTEYVAKYLIHVLLCGGRCEYELFMVEDTQDHDLLSLLSGGHNSIWLPYTRTTKNHDSLKLISGCHYQGWAPPSYAF